MKVTDFNILIENEESIDKLSIGGLTLAKNNSYGIRTRSSGWPGPF